MLHIRRSWARHPVLPSLFQPTPWTSLWELTAGKGTRVVWSLGPATGPCLSAFTSLTSLRPGEVPL